MLRLFRVTGPVAHGYAGSADTVEQGVGLGQTQTPLLRGWVGQEDSLGSSPRTSRLGARQLPALRDTYAAPNDAARFEDDEVRERLAERSTLHPELDLGPRPAPSQLDRDLPRGRPWAFAKCGADLAQPGLVMSLELDDALREVPEAVLVGGHDLVDL